MKVLVSVFATPWTVACQAPLSVKFSRQEYWNVLPFPSQGDLPDPGIKFRSPALQGSFSTAHSCWGMFHSLYHLRHRGRPKTFSCFPIMTLFIGIVSVNRFFFLNNMYIHLVHILAKQPVFCLPLPPQIPPLTLSLSICMKFYHDQFISRD